MKRFQRGDAGAAMLVMMVVLIGGWFWHSGADGPDGRHMSRQRQVIPAEKTPLELDETYARGEISREEYLQRRADLLRR